MLDFSAPIFLRRSAGVNEPPRGGEWDPGVPSAPEFGAMGVEEPAAEIPSVLCEGSISR